MSDADGLVRYVLHSARIEVPCDVAGLRTGGWFVRFCGVRLGPYLFDHLGEFEAFSGLGRALGYDHETVADAWERLCTLAESQIDGAIARARVKPWNAAGIRHPITRFQGDRNT